MASQMLMKTNVLFILCLLCLANSTMSSRLIPHANMNLMKQRLKLESGSTNCWASLLELQSCTGEVIQFFYDGETYLGPECCDGIRVIEHHCWPAMLTTLGFTSEEGDILLEYCDSEEGQEIGN